MLRLISIFCNVIQNCAPSTNVFIYRFVVLVHIFHRVYKTIKLRSIQSNHQKNNPFILAECSLPVSTGLKNDSLTLSNREFNPSIYLQSDGERSTFNGYRMQTPSLCLYNVKLKWVSRSLSLSLPLATFEHSNNQTND